jgi:AMMECR1 domain-containing protein
LISPLEPIPAGSEAQLLTNVEPGVDGVVIRRGGASGTFLPAVWDKLPDPLTFLRHLEAKAGLRPGHWPSGMQAWRYRSTEYRRRALDIAHRSAA